MTTAHPCLSCGASNTQAVLLTDQLALLGWLYLCHHIVGFLWLGVLVLLPAVICWPVLQGAPDPGRGRAGGGISGGHRGV